mgnify:FL=1
MKGAQPTGKKSILFLCIGNSCRSQMAEAIARHYLKDLDVVASAGSAPSPVRENALHVLKEAGISTVGLYSKHVDVWRDREWDFVVTLCADGQACPIPPRHGKLIHAPMPDPVGTVGSEEKVMNAFRDVRDQIKDFILSREFER